MSRTTRSLAAGAKDVAPIILGIIPFGLVAGAAVAETGFGVPEALGMSLLVNAGAAQLTATALFAEGAPMLVVVGTALVVNARLLIYGTSLAPVLEPHVGRWRPVVGHPLVDQSYAAVMTRGQYMQDINLIMYYFGSWLTLASIWQVTNIAGAVAGSFVPASWSLEFAVPLVFLAMLVPALKNRTDVEVALVAAVTAALLVPTLPMETGLLSAIVIGMLWGAFREPRVIEEGVEG